MGYHNAAAVMAIWGRLPHGPMRLLTHMALVSLDPPGKPGQQACLYWGSDQLQMLAMGYGSKSAPRLLRRTRAELVESGALVLARHSGRGRSPTWLVITDLPKSGT